MSNDTTIDQVLESEGSALDPTVLKTLAQSVAAAPATDLPGHGSGKWQSLLGHAPSTHLAQALDDLVAEAAGRYADVLDAPDPEQRLIALRAELSGRDLQGFIVPLSDENYTEFVPLRAHRLAWLTGFTGSAGTAIVLDERAALFVDGRYTLQVRDQIPATLFSFHHVTEEPPRAWLAENLRTGARFGYDPWLHTEDEVTRLAAACKKADAELIAVDSNPIDAVWQDQPPTPVSPTVPHDLAFAGETSVDKRRRLAEKLSADQLDAAVLTAPDSIAWLLNIRGADVSCTPLPLAFAVLHADASVDLLIDQRKLAEGLGQHLGPEVRISERSSFGYVLDELASGAKRVGIDPSSTAAWISQRLRQGGIEPQSADDPCTLPKALKNDVELNGTRAAHLRDGAALTCFLAWLEKEALSGDLDELIAAATLAEFRAGNERIQSLSFNTISGAGPNGAIVHYRAAPATNRRLEQGQLFLLDSGAQYLDGTTDVTRTVAIGEPSEEMRDRFTRVLRGHIAVATCKFPKGTTGSQIDTLARHFLWQAGLDYDHGTGHGVGSYLGVHEGPQRISKLPNKVALQPGMIVSNEPGYYKTGAFGIRIENLVAVVRSPVGEADREFYAFETLTHAPIDRTLIAADLLTAEEIEWVDRYHAQVRDALADRVDQVTRGWLEDVTRPLAAG